MLGFCVCALRYGLLRTALVGAALKLSLDIGHDALARVRRPGRSGKRGKSGEAEAEGGAAGERAPAGGDADGDS